MIILMMQDIGFELGGIQSYLMFRCKSLLQIKIERLPLE
jgi:hypothetical protein